MKKLTTEQREKLYQHRLARLKKLIYLQAPQPIIYSAAETLFLTQHNNSFWRYAWASFREWVYELRVNISSEFGIRKLQRQGWQRPCAVDIYFGDAETEHVKGDCHCDDEWQEICEAMRKGSK